MLSNMAATNRRWLFNFKGIKIKYNLKCPLSAALATFHVLNYYTGLVAAVTHSTETEHLHQHRKPYWPSLLWMISKYIWVISSNILGHPGWSHISCSINMEIPSLRVSTWKIPHLPMCLRDITKEGEK